MQALFDAVIDLVALVSPSKVHALAGAFRCVRSPDDLPDVDSLVGTPAARSSLSSLIAAWEHSEIPAVELAGMLVGATEVRKAAQGEPPLCRIFGLEDTVDAGSACSESS